MKGNPLPRNIDQRILWLDEMAALKAGQVPTPQVAGGARCYEEGDAAKGKIPIRRKSR